MSVYDLEEAFKIIEDDLVNQIINGVKKTTSKSVLKEDNIAVWRANQLKELQEFKKRNKKYFTKDRKKALYKAIEDSLEEVYKEAGSNQQKKILDAVKDGLKVHKSKSDDEISLSFTGVNDRKLNSLIEETQKNLYAAETSAVRYAEDQYRQIIFNSNVYFNTGSGNLMKCIDMATRNFLEAGINNIEYKNGRRVNIQSYAEMALRTAEKRSYIQGEAKMRDEYGLGLVIVNRRGNACPKCMQFVGKIFNDDVYGSQKPNPKYPLLSTAIAGGLYHPNCKDVHTSYFPGITTKYPAPTKKDLESAEKQYKLEQQQRYNERQIRKYKRLADGTLDEQEAKTYKSKVSQWQEKQRELIDENPTLRRNYIRESVLGKTKPSTKTFEVPELPEEKKILKLSDFKNVEVKDNLNKIKDKEVRDAQLEQLEHLFNKYGDSKYKLTIECDGRLGDSDAYYTYSLKKDGLKELNKIKINTGNKTGYTKINGNYEKVVVGMNHSAEEIIKTEKIFREKKYFTPTDDENILKGTITHEFGHYIERKMGDFHFVHNNTDLNKYSYYDFCDDIRERMHKEYEKRTGKNLMDLIGKYGKTNSLEFFAEAFKTYELQKSCPYKKEMEDILKEYNIIK